MTCVWDPDPGCLGDEWDEMDVVLQERSLMLATSALINLTYGRVGTCPIIVRPTPTEPRCGCGWNPHARSGQCGHEAPVAEVLLPGPVGPISAIIIDGVAVVTNAGWDETAWDEIVWDPKYQWSDFRLDDGFRLVWQGEGPSPIPAAQDLNKPLSAVGTWGVIYSQSHPVGADARLAVAMLAKEFAKACLPKAKCSLPRGVTSVARNGVSFTIDAGLFPNGLTGIDIVDQFIMKWTPAGTPTRRPMVFNPRRGKGYRVSSAEGLPRPSSDLRSGYPFGSE